MRKLVRDKIPEIMRTKSLSAKFLMATERKFEFYLRKKIKEEINEMLKAKSKQQITEEMADVMEILDTFLAFHQISKKEMKKIRKDKVKTKGRFRRKILLINKSF